MAEVKRLEREMTDLQSRLDEISSTMEKSTKELQKEQLKSRNASKHSQVRMVIMDWTFVIIEPPLKKTNKLHMQKQRR